MWSFEKRRQFYIGLVLIGLVALDSYWIGVKRGYITLNDYKEHAEEKLQSKWINPKSEGVVGNKDKINNNLKERSVMLLRNLTEVIYWFQSVEGKQSCTFSSFIEDLIHINSENLWKLPC